MPKDEDARVFGRSVELHIGAANPALLTPQVMSEEVARIVSGLPCDGVVDWGSAEA